MNEVKNDLYLGLFLTVLFAIVVWGLIPFGIDTPQSHDPGQLPPAAYPTWISVTGLCASLLITFNALVRLLKKTNLANSEKQKPFTVAEYFAPFFAFLSLFIFYFFINEIGMLLGAFVLYAVFAILCGERKWTRLLIVDSILVVVMYLFFVKIATVPIPLGVLANILP